MALLDETDIEILHSLQKDAKINAKELSEKLHISKTPIYERIKRLENEGYIKGYVALVDNKKIGLPLNVTRREVFMISLSKWFLRIWMPIINLCSRN